MMTIHSVYSYRVTYSFESVCARRNRHSENIVIVHCYPVTACNTTHGIAKAFLSVCLSVKRAHCDKTKETSAHILTPHETSFI